MLFYNFKNILLPKKIIIIRNKKEAQEVFRARHGGEEYQQMHPSRAGGP
jgi:hypothetical protein